MKQLLEELYKIEPELREKEGQIEEIVAQMLVHKPITKVSENFKKVLKNRLISEMALRKEGPIRMKNKRLRFFWHFITGGLLLTSFAITFGFLSIFPTINTSSPKPLQALPLKDNEEMGRTEGVRQDSNNQPIALNRQNKNVSKKIMTPKIDELLMKKKSEIPEISTDKQLVMNTSEITNKTISNTPHPASADAGARISGTRIKETTIAYIGDNPDIGASLQSRGNVGINDKRNSSPRILMSQEALLTSTEAPIKEADRSNQSKPMTNGSLTKKLAVNFQGIVGLAQKEADSLIEEKDRALYVLKTPYLSYISEDSSEKNTVELVSIYAFPLVRIDGKESKVQEIKVMAP